MSNPQQTLAQVRVTDPILTTVVQGYRDPEFVGSYLFPEIPVDISAGKVVEFGREDFRLANTRRSPGADTKEIMFGHLGRPYVLEDHGLDGKLPREHQRDAAVLPGIDLASRVTMRTMRTIRRGLEVDQAALAINAANYDANHKIALTGTAKWSDPASKPLAQIVSYSEAIRTSTGMRPNTLHLSALAFSALQQNESILDKIKYTAKGVVTTELLAALLNVKNVWVGDSVSADDTAAATLTDIWGNNAILAYVPGQSAIDQGEPSYGYTYVMKGHPSADQTYWDAKKRSWLFPVNFERVPVLTGIASGFLIQNPN